MSTTIELTLDQQTLEQAQKVAHQRQATLESLLIELIEHLARLSDRRNPILGMFADDADLLDQIIESVMTSRETDPLRLPNG